MVDATGRGGKGGIEHDLYYGFAASFNKISEIIP